MQKALKIATSSSQERDPYECGLEIGEVLSSTQPECIIVFTSEHYAETSDFMDGLSDGLNKPDCIIFGNTGDGVYHQNGHSEVGATAMAFNSNGTIRFKASLQTGLDSESSRTLGSRLAEDVMRNENQQPGLSFVIGDGLFTDGVGFLEGIKEHLKTPFVGGLAADNRKLEKTQIYYDGKAMENALGLLSFFGDFKYQVNCCSGSRPVGELGVVDRSKGVSVESISGKSARDFIEASHGDWINSVDTAVLPLAVINEDESFLLRTSMKPPGPNGEISYFGRIPEGSKVRLAETSKELFLSGVHQALENMNIDFEPQGALIVSCAARKWTIGEDIDKEISLLLEKVGVEVPIIGFPSYGEIGPIQKDGKLTPTYFHNASYVAVVFG